MTDLGVRGMPASGAMRMPELEMLLGDPFEDGPFSYAAIVEDDEQRRLNPTAEQRLAEWGATAEFVPASLGGRWVSTSELVSRLRPLFRRDPAVGLGFGLTTLMAAVNVWTAGDDSQREETAGRLLAGERIAVGFHELDHGNDLLRNETRAERVGDEWRVTGGKQVINNIDRAESVLLFVRTAEGAGPRAHSLLLWRTALTPAGTAASTDRRVETVGMRGCLIGTVELDGLLVPDAARVGREGTATETALTAFQITRAVMPAIAVGAVDAALHLAMRYAEERRLYRGRVIDLPHARSLLADAWADLLIADVLSDAVVRALHLEPSSCLLLTAASKYLVPQLLNDAMHGLSVLLGSTFYARVEPYAVFEKLLRDLTVVPIGHAGSTACLTTILPNLQRWERRSDRGSADPRLLDPTTELPELDFTALGLRVGEGDPLGSIIGSTDARAVLGTVDPELAERVTGLAERYEAFKARVRDLPPNAFGTDADAATFALAREYTLFQAAGACLGRWLQAARGPGGAEAGTSWLDAALRRIESRLSGRKATLPETVVDAAVADLEDCVHASRSIAFERVPIFRDPEPTVGGTAHD